MNFNDIPQFITSSGYEISVGIAHLKTQIDEWVNEPEYGLQIKPDFQREHVWTPAQQTAFVEYFLQGGRSGMVLFFNCPWWNNYGHGEYREFVCVDGLQRLTALLGFLNNEVPAFNHLHREFEGKLFNHSLRLNVNDLQTREQVLTWYLQMNGGGTPHSEAELRRVRRLLEAEQAAAGRGR